MKANSDVNPFDILKADLKSCFDKEAVKHQLNDLFRDVTLADRSFLDIGGGSGLHSFFASAAGAKEVVCIEPELSGSTPGARRTVLSNIDCIGEKYKVVFYNGSFQEYESSLGRYDVILLNSSVNHLDEDSCITLNTNEVSRSIYKGLFGKMYSLASYNADVIITDCSRYNFWALLPVRHPFSPSIEWHKHQPPRIWSSLLEEVGFTTVSIKWSSFNRIRQKKPFRLLLERKWVVYLINSHFRIHARKLHNQ